MFLTDDIIEILTLPGRHAIYLNIMYYSVCGVVNIDFERVETVLNM